MAGNEALLAKLHELRIFCYRIHLIPQMWPRATPIPEREEMIRWLEIFMNDEIIVAVNEYFKVLEKTFNQTGIMVLEKRWTKCIEVVLNVGLCIALYDITHIGHSYIFPGDGASHTEVNFRYIVFRPVLEEVLTGKIRSCSREGVHVTLGFFDDVLIPVNALQHPSRFDETDQAWVWEYTKPDGDKHDLFMDSGETIRFRITSEVFEESLPTGPPGTECVLQPVAPYRLHGGINEPGLGLLTWWEGMGGVGGSDQDDNTSNDEQDAL